MTESSRLSLRVALAAVCGASACVRHADHRARSNVADTTTRAAIEPDRGTPTIDVSARDVADDPQRRRRWAALGTTLGLGVTAIATGAGVGIASDDDGTVTVTALLTSAGMLLLAIGVPVVAVRMKLARGRPRVDRPHTIASPRAWLELAPPGLRLRF